MTLYVEKFHIEQLRPCDYNCETVAWTLQPHQSARDPNVICDPGNCVYYEHDLEPGESDAFGALVYHSCSARLQVYIPLDTEKPDR